MSGWPQATCLNSSPYCPRKNGLHSREGIPRGSIRMSDCDGFTAPQRGPRSERDACFRCHTGADSGAAIKEQQAARLQSAAQFKEQMALMRQQYADAQKVKPATFAPAAPLPTASADAYNAALDQKRAAKMRFG